MIEKIKDELLRIGAKVDRERLFELSPVYLFPDFTDNSKHLQYLLNNLRSDLEKNGVISSTSHVFLRFFPAYNSRENQFGLYDETGTFRSNLERWLSYINMRYHFEHGIILIDIKHYKDIKKDNLWRKQFFSDIRKYKKDFLFFISCGEDDADAIQSLFEKEVFTVSCKLDDFTAESYFQWFITQLDEYTVSLDEAGKTELKNLLTKYEQDISHHILELWLKSLLWSYYSSEEAEPILPLRCLSEDLLLQTIDKCQKHKKETDSKIGFM